MAYPYDEEDRRSALTQGLLAAGLAALGARKGSEYNALGQAGLLGLTGYNAALRTATDARESQALRKMREQQYAQQQAEWQRQQQERAAMQRAAGGAFVGGQPAIPGGEAESAEGGMTPGLPAQGGQFNPQAYIAALQREGMTQQAIATAEKYAPKRITPDAPKPEHFTGDSLAKFAQTGDWNALVPVSKPQERWEQIPTPRGSPPGQLWERNLDTNQTRAVGSVAPVTNVRLNMPPLELKEQGAKGEANVKYYTELKAQADAARKENAILSSLEKNPLNTGRGVPLTSAAAAWLTYGGMGGDKVRQLAANSETFQRDAMDLVLTKQIAQKGPQTEADAKRMELTVASLGNTREANAAIIKFAKAQAKRTIQQQEFYNDWWRKKRTYEGADEAWFEGTGGQSLFEDPELKSLAPSSGETVIDFSSLGKRR